MPSAHGLNKPAGLEGVPHSRFHHGRFGRLFRNLDPAEYSQDALKALAATMVDPEVPPAAGGGGGWGGQEPDPAQGDNPNIPSGYTYLGQFIDHDITFDPASSLLRSNDPNALHNFRTPRFDLDNLYGEGPDDEPFLYDRESGKQKMLLEERTEPAGEFDLPRNGRDEVALIGDPRNDENVIVSQLQVVFLRAHNKLVDLVQPAPGVPPFDEARRQLRWHYQYVVINDFLRRIVPQDVLETILPEDGSIDWCKSCQCHFGDSLPFMPVEFSVAAYRFGHSMVRPKYDLNGVIRDKPIFKEGSERGDGQDLRGFQKLIPQWGVQWPLFFELEGNPQPSRLIDTKLAEGLFALRETDRPSLAQRNLERGVALGVPWGEAVAAALGVEPLSEGQIDLAGRNLDAQWLPEFAGKTPLWFYVLKEAELLGNGLQLGPVGGWIVAQTLICLMAGDVFAFPNIDPKWTPAKVGFMPHEGEFEMADLIRFATS